MSGPRRRVRVEKLELGENVLNDAQSHYLVRVLRLEAGATVELFDGTGSQATATITETADGWIADIREIEETPPPPLSLTVAAATPKGDRADLMVEKVAELGAHRLVLLETERSVVKLKPGSNKLERFRRIADSAARQSLQSRTMRVEGPVPLAEFIKGEFDYRWLAHPGGHPLTAPTLDAPFAGALLIGPEGGWSESEVLQAQKAGYTWITMSPHVLRVETAAIAGAALILGATAGRMSNNEQV